VTIGFIPKVSAGEGVAEGVAEAEGGSLERSSGAAIDRRSVWVSVGRARLLNLLRPSAVPREKWRDRTRPMIVYTQSLFLKNYFKILDATISLTRYLEAYGTKDKNC
jgi:hypothetical protein